MTVRKAKGEWQFGYKDTYSLDYSLSPIIYAGLKKLHDVLEDRHKNDKGMGVPAEYVKDHEEGVTDADVQAWLDDIKRMMYAFDASQEPDISEYKFSFPNVFNGEGPVDLTCDNPEGRDAYHQAMKEWEEKKQEGLNLFALRYADLWW